MLDKNALSQLQSLKQEIQSSVPRFTGRVRATSGRYGFVNTEDGSSYFLAPEEMEKVLPADVIDFRVEPTPEGKEHAIVEALVSSTITEVFGTYIVRGKGFFIDTDHAGLKRWLFVPPTKRLQAKEGDLVRAHIHQHPFPSGKCQAAIDEVIGNVTDAGVEQRFTLAKWDLPTEFGQVVRDAVQQLQAHGLDDVLKNRTDLTHLPFVTIDSASTRDLDDALLAEAQSDGWTLWIAIADPSAVIAPGSELDQEAAKRGTSVYLPELMLPMLPSEVSEQLCSLQAGQSRPALVVELRLGEDGSIRQTHIHQALICSQAKLSYSQVAQFIEGETSDIGAELQGPLLHLHDCANALLSWRHAHALVMDDRPDFKLVFDGQGKVQDIVAIERTIAHRLVEESMLACNYAVAQWLASHNSGVFIEHSGVRSERMAEVGALLQEQLGLTELNLADLTDYVRCLQQAEASTNELPLRMIVSRQQERSNFSLEAKPHMGLGFTCYTAFTSPLRRYNDLLVHRIVKALLNNDAVELPSVEQLTALQATQGSARTASLQAETWLKLDWLAKQEAQQIYSASILHISAVAMTVRLDANGIEGTIERRQSTNGWVFDSKTLSVTCGDQQYLLGQNLNVKLKDVQPQARVVQFTWA